VVDVITRFHAGRFAGEGRVEPIRDTGNDLLSLRITREPPCQEHALDRRTIRGKTRSKEKGRYSSLTCRGAIERLPSLTRPRLVD
jgi:hypothetical protein